MASSCFSANSPMGNQPLYEEISVVGTGAYGTVYKGYDLKTSRIVAMKRIRIQITEEGLPISTIREIGYLRQLEKYDHENIVRLLDVCQGPRLPSEQSIILIFEFIEYDLDNYMKAFANVLSQNKIIDLTRQIFRGVDFLHMNRIIHRDLKPQNILVTKEGKVKIADFGLARLYGFTMALTSVVVTLWYRSPEVLLHSTYSSSVDTWSLGCIFAELYMRRPLFIGNSDVDQLFKIFNILGLPSKKDWPENSVIPLDSFSNNNNLKKIQGEENLRALIPNMDDNGIDLLKKLLDFNTQERITVKDALNHVYFQSSCFEGQFGSASCDGVIDYGIRDDENQENEKPLRSLPDINHIFQPNILKRKRNLKK